MYRYRPSGRASDHGSNLRRLLSPLRISRCLLDRLYRNPVTFGPALLSAESGSTSPAPTSVAAPPVFFAVAARMLRTSADRSSLLRSSISATTPEICAAATDVPVV